MEMIYDPSYSGYYDDLDDLQGHSPVAMLPETRPFVLFYTSLQDFS